MNTIGKIPLAHNDHDRDYIKKTLIIHAVPAIFDESDIQQAIKCWKCCPIFVSFGIPYESDKNGRTENRVYLKFSQYDDVNKVMKKWPNINLRGEIYMISRLVPSNEPYYAHQTKYLRVRVKCKTFDENKADRIFRSHIKMISAPLVHEWIGTDKVVYEFNSYDTVDRIIIEMKSFFKQGHNFTLEKYLAQPLVVPSRSQMKYCFHVKKLPFDITSRTLSNFFKVPLYDILLKPGNQWIAASSSNGGCLLSEAWIKYTDKQIDNEKPSTSVIYRGEAINIEINRIQEPYENYELCPYFQKGSCSRLSSECYSKHILCDQPYNCDTSNCLYGHRRNPPIASNNKVHKKKYRLRITNIPVDTSKRALSQYFGCEENDIQLAQERPSASPRFIVAYLINQRSENFLRMGMKKWMQNSSPFPEQSVPLEFQLELNVDYYDFENIDEQEVLIPFSQHSLSDTEAELACDSKSSKMNVRQARQISKAPWNRSEFLGPIDLADLAADWSVVNPLQIIDSRRKSLYKVVHNQTKSREAVICMYDEKESDIVRRDLRTLKIINDMNPQQGFIQSNIEENSKLYWIIAERHKAVHLESLMNQLDWSYRKSLEVFCEILIFHARIQKHHPDVEIDGVNIYAMAETNEIMFSTIGYINDNWSSNIDGPSLCITGDFKKFKLSLSAFFSWLISKDKKLFNYQANRNSQLEKEFACIVTSKLNRFLGLMPINVLAEFQEIFKSILKESQICILYSGWFSTINDIVEKLNQCIPNVEIKRVSRSFNEEHDLVRYSITTDDRAQEKLVIVQIHSDDVSSDAKRITLNGLIGNKPKIQNSFHDEIYEDQLNDSKSDLWNSVRSDLRYIIRRLCS